MAFDDDRVRAFRRCSASISRRESSSGRRAHRACRARARNVAASGECTWRGRIARRAGRAAARRATSAASTCRSIVCGARSRAIPPIPLISDGARRGLPAGARRIRRRDEHNLTRSIRRPAPGLPRFCAVAAPADAEGPLRARTAHRHPADGAAAIGRRVLLHGAALAAGDVSSVGGVDAGHRCVDRRLSKLSARQELRNPRSHRRRTDAHRSSIFCRPARFHRLHQSRSFRSSIARCRTRSAARSAGPSGSTPSAAPISSKSAFSSKMR